MVADEIQMPIGRVFADLKAKGRIAGKRRLVMKKAKWSGNFKAGILRWNNIYYNEKYSSLDDDLLRFALLHEENHKTTGQNWKILVGFIIAGYAFLAYIYLVDGHRNLTALNLAGAVMFFLFLMSLRAFETPLQEDETRADLHAVRVMIESFGVQTPSVAVASLFGIIDKEQGRHTSLPYRAMRFVLGGVHPPDKVRIKAIQELEESLTKGAGADGDPLH